MPPSNSFEKLEGNDFALREHEMLAGVDDKNVAMVMELVTRRLLENAG